MNVLEIKDLTKHYPAFTLDKASFSLREGRITGFIGRNGAGKSTTLKALLSLVHPDAGEISFFGLPFAENENAIKQRIGFVAGGVDYYPTKKLRTITAVTRTFYENWDDEAYRGYLRRFNLDENKTPAQLSAGMKVKYALALALSHRAELLLLDEPTSGLDPVSRDDLLDEFLALCDEGVTILFSTHITTDLEKCADDIVYIKNGRIIEAGDMKEFKEKYRLVALENIPDGDIASKLIGCKRAKNGYTAIINAADAAALGINGESASLEDIMVHMEKESDNEEENK